MEAQDEPAPVPTPAQPFKSALSQPTPESNPWLTSTLSAGPSRKKNSQIKTDKASRTLAKSAAAREEAMEDERVDIVDPASTSTPASTSAASAVGGKKRKQAAEDSDDESEDGMLPNGLKGFKQRDLVAEAFAGDDVVQVCPSARGSRLSLIYRTLPLRKRGKWNPTLQRPKILLCLDG
jgi:U3 small nucleolar RNA-associated protein 14